MKITEVLRAEHCVFHNLFDHVEATLPKVRTLAEVKVMARMIESLLEPHSRAEDELLVEPLEHCLAQMGQRENFHHEHEGIETGLSQARSARTLGAARKSLLTAVAASRTHFDKEERILFPLAEKVLKARTLGELGDRFTQRRETETA
jgi:hemerythrin-like domain-containing protein